MSAFKAGDLIFVQEAALPPSGSSQGLVAMGLYLREATADEISAVPGATAPSSWYAAFEDPYFSWNVPSPSTDSAGNAILIPDSVIIGAIHTGIDADLIL